MDHHVKRICFCGRPNVGKSSLYNRILGRKKALVLDKPGVTRDVYRTQVELGGEMVELADLAGLELWGQKFDSNSKRASEEATLAKLATKAALDYLKTADLVLFVVDGRQMVTPSDEELSRIIRASGRPVCVVLSKVEGSVEEEAQLEVARLGWGEGIPTSAEHNVGVETLKEEIIRLLDLKPAEEESAGEEDDDDFFEEEEEIEEVVTKGLSDDFARGTEKDRPIRLGVYGRPNVGKSTLVNHLLGEKRMITSPIAGTTIDAVDTAFVRYPTSEDESAQPKYYQIVDTAGIRRKSKTERGVEVLSVVQAIKSIERVDLALFLIDGFEGVTDQDEKVAGELIKAGKPIILVVNKWDICRVDRDAYAERIRTELGFLDYAPLLFISAEKGQGIEPLWDLADEILSQRFTVAPTAELNRFLELVEGTNNPTNVRLYYASQTSKNPPTITCMVSNPSKVHFAYERFLKNELRQRYGWMGSPLKLIFKARKRSESKRDRRT